MKKSTVLLIANLLFLSIFLSACSNPFDQPDLEPTEHDDFTILEHFDSMVLQESVTPESARFAYDNRTDRTFTLGEAYTLEVHLDNRWYLLPVIVEGEYGFQDIGYDLPPNEMIEMEINWEWLYGKLMPGEYRIIQEVLDVDEPGDYETYTIATEFEVE